MRKLVFLFFLACSVSGVVAQEKTEQELKEEIVPKKAEIAKLQIPKLPYYRLSCFFW